MANVNINIRMDEELKEKFETFCSDIGMSMTTAFTVFAKKAVREYRIPFEVGAERPNKETLQAINEVNVMRNNPEKGRTFDDADSMLEELLK